MKAAIAGRLAVFLALHVVATDTEFRIQVESAGWQDGNFTAFRVEGQKVDLETGRGLNVVILNSENGEVLGRHVYDTGFQGNGSTDFSELVRSLPEGALVLVAVEDDASEALSDAAKEALESLGATKLGNITYRSSYALIGIKGGAALAEAVAPPGAGPVTLELMFSVSSPGSNSSNTSSAAGGGGAENSSLLNSSSSSSTEAPEASSTSTQAATSTEAPSTTNTGVTANETSKPVETTTTEAAMNGTSKPADQLSGGESLRSKSHLVLVASVCALLAHCRGAWC